ncbi:polyprenyl synthetase family protein [Olivibacter domesticus]|uniref:Geranylgeranyl diphosphate synthase, type II n=1 Tax=Olivibacter domesticus TaxID=407022 RepID=A0A1H7UCF0_OLID1|nr:polyprenyl synthetase family protein [Olivibacter domesticus]SEL94434.1 geranylgeranyl diphosphate synthase, type II [Olivibacter domesticus]
MHSFSEICKLYQKQRDTFVFPTSPKNLYGSINYFLDLPGKRVRPAMCLMVNELFDNIHADTYIVAYAFDLFHNFTLIHDDIMDRSPLRRGRPTLHIKYNEGTAILAGDTLLIQCYALLNQIESIYRTQIIELFADTARLVCEGQQLDIDMEGMEMETVNYADYLEMITLKTSVLLGGAAQCGAMMGGADEGQQVGLYEFAKNIGIAFQIQDDYLDTFGASAHTGKQVGGDILENKKTALLVKAFEQATSEQLIRLKEAFQRKGEDKIRAVMDCYKILEVDLWAVEAIRSYTAIAFDKLEEIDVPVFKKEKLLELASSLLVRQS